MFSLRCWGNSEFSHVAAKPPLIKTAMNFAIRQRYISANQRFEGKPKLKTMRRNEFTFAEYRKLHTAGRSWNTKTTNAPGTCPRTMCYNFMLIMRNTGMRPPEAKNLRWRDIMPAKDRDGKEILVLFVQGKGKSRKLVARKSVGDYLDRICATLKATGQDDAVLTTISGKPAKFLYEDVVEKLLTGADLKIGPNGTPRSVYCFRHTCATFQLSEGVDVSILAGQMGTSVKIIEQHYWQVNTIKHDDGVLQAINGWEPMANNPADSDGTARASAGAKARLAVKAVRLGQTKRS